MSNARITQSIRESGIKVVRVKTNKAAAGKIGIHLLRPTQRELEQAIETAERDMFPAVYIHDFATWGAQRSKPRKQHQLDTVQGWIEKLSKSAHGQYKLDRLKNVYGVELDATLAKMSSDQLQVVLMLVSGTYGVGCEDTREHTKSLKQSA